MKDMNIVPKLGNYKSLTQDIKRSLKMAPITMCAQPGSQMKMLSCTSQRKSKVQTRDSTDHVLPVYYAEI